MENYKKMDVNVLSGNMNTMSVQAKLTSIRVDLEPTFKDQFNRLKQYFGIQANTDMVRFLIKEKFREIFDRQISTVSLEEKSNREEQEKLTEEERLQLQRAAEDYLQQFDTFDEAQVQEFLEDRYHWFSPAKIRAGVEFVCSLKKN